MSHGNIALFIPHNGCPHQCSFCNQQNITGQRGQPSPQDVVHAIEQTLSCHGEAARHWEIAFFGGSFTAIEESYQQSLLEAAYPYVARGQVGGIRLSTRPDAVDPSVLNRLRQWGVTAIELGAQSMRDTVLQVNQRGHTAQTVRDASCLIRAFGFSLGLQMMTGLYGDTVQGAWETARALAELHPDTMRIYPALVLPGTALERWLQEGKYRPMELEETVALCAELLDFFEARKIKVIRLGLHSAPELEQGRLAGPWHPAFRELCESRRFLHRLQNALRAESIPPGNYEIQVHPTWLSKAMGQKKSNRDALLPAGYRVRFTGEEAVPPGAFILRKSEGNQRQNDKRKG